ncbi:uncharacterized protein METZ01_LOCUS409018, partial [marine metagenome]
ESNPSHGTLSTEASTSFLSFDGSNDYVDIPAPNLAGLTNWTISYWLNWDMSNSSTIHFICAGNVTEEFEIHTGGGSGNQGLRVINDGPYGNEYLDITGAIPDDNSWHFYTVVNVSGSSLTLYRDGSQIGTRSIVRTSPTTSVRMRIGSRGSGGYWLDGQVDEVAIWGKALTASEISAVYNSGNNLDLLSNSGDYTSSGDLEGYWDFNEGSGSTVTDVSGNGNNGVIYGATWSGESNANAVTYTPNANYHGTDSFTYTVSDGSVTSQAATVTLTIAPVN